MKKSFLTLAISIVAMIICIFGLISCTTGTSTGNTPSEKGKVPVYQGMTISKLQTYSMPLFLKKGSENGNKDNNGNHNGWYKGDYDDDSSIDENNPYPENNPNENIQNEIESSLTVEGADKEIYYATENEDIYINIHINNPDNFEILSFTINGKKYSSYMFEYGSTMELIIIKYNVGSVSGIVDYTIDAIKYVDGVTIKDVLIGGEKTIRAGVRRSNQVTAEVSNLLVNTNDVSFNVSVEDSDNLIAFSEGAVKAVLYNGEEIVEVKELDVGKNIVTFNNLSTNSVYQYAIVGYYDALEHGFDMNTLYVSAFKTEAIVLFDNIVITQDEIEFGFIWNSKVNNKQLTSLALYKDTEKIQDILLTAAKVENLLSGVEYKLVAEYLNGENVESIELQFATMSKQKPIVSIFATEILKTSVSFDINIEDVDNVCEITKISFITETGDEILAEDLSIRVFEDLNLLEGGKIKVEYAYDLNDGSGINEDGVELNVYFGSVGVMYELISNDTAYAVTSIGSCVETEIVIPRFYNNLPVTVIGANAFKNCTRVTSVLIPDSVTSIEDFAFRGCTSLTNIAIGDNVEGIGLCVFENCSSLTSVVIGNNVKAIGDYAFSGCGITTIVIPDSVISIESYAFNGCANLNSVEIGDSVEIIARYAFNGCANLNSVEIGTSVKIIGQYAFNGCTNLNSIEIGDSVEIIEEYAFNACLFLMSVRIPKSVTYIGCGAFFECGFLTIYCEAESQPNGWDANWYLPHCTVIWNFKDFGFTEDYDYIVTEDNTVTLMLYKGNETEVVIPSIINGNTVTAIGNRVFSGCSGLTSIEIPDSVTSIGASAFSGCNNLTIYCEAESQPIGWDVNWNSANCPVIWGVKDFGETEECDYVITNDDTVTLTAYKGIGSEVVIPSTINGKAVTIIGDYAFDSCTSLTSVVIPDSVTSIGDYAFCKCWGLISIVIPASITSIGSDAFGMHDLIIIYCEAESQPIGWNDDWNSANRPVIWGVKDFGKTEECDYVITNDDTVTLTAYKGIGSEVVIPSTINGKAVTIIGDYAFRSGFNLTSVKLPDTIISIGSYAFRGCSSLTSVVIGDSVTSIGDYAFDGCSSLKEVYYNGTADGWKNITIDSSNYNLTNATRYYYSESQPAEEGNFWHYDENGVIVEW